MHIPASSQQNSEFGWALSPRDTLRILIFYVEIDYEEVTGLEQHPDGSKVWAVGELPDYADALFDAHYLEKPVGLMTQYYREISLGNLVVLGDYYPELITMKHSEVGNSPPSVLRHITQRFENDSLLTTRHGFSLSDFDYRVQSPGIGKRKEWVAEGFEGVDHVMVVLRNYHRIPSETGQASPSSSIRLGGKRANTNSIFGGGRKVPFGIMRHELNHLFLGSNNFHCGGGNSPMFSSYFLHVQGGWSMMGAAHSSLLTCSGWDRHRLGWKAEGNEYLISARSLTGSEVHADLDPTIDSRPREFILRDFVTTGDALRIKLPFIPEDKFQQWIWIENHGTARYNNSPFDRYQYGDRDCTADVPSGLFMALQADASQKEGKAVFQSVRADYLRPIPANGFYDAQWDPTPLKLDAYCINGVDYPPYALQRKFENPLSGNHEQEMHMRDFEEPYGVLDAKDIVHPNTRIVPGGHQRFNFMGGRDHAFHTGGNTRLGIGTNPSSASMLTKVNNRRPARPHPQDNEAVYLSGVAVEILETLPDGAIHLRVYFDDHLLENDRRWAGPKIVLSNHRKEGADLTVEGSLTLARGETPTRLNDPDTLSDGKVVFSDPTLLTVQTGAEMEVQGRLNLLDDSKLHIEEGALLTVSRGSKVVVAGQTVLVAHPGAHIEGRGRFRIGRNAAVHCADEATYRHLQSRTFQKKRILLQGR